MIGELERYDRERGFGFIRTTEGKSVFVNAGQYRKDAIGKPKDGDRLSFDIEAGPRGDRAVHLVRI